MRYGYFDDAAREYVIDRTDVPFSMTNYLGTQRMGAVVSHNAGGYCWLDSPQYHRITRFRPNGVPMDFPGHYVYLRDDETGKYWSVSWQPTGLDLNGAKYVCRHGLSYSTYEAEVDGIAARQTLFIPREADANVDPVEIFDVRVRNDSDRPRRISVTGYVEFSFHNIDIDNQNFQMSLYCAGSFQENGAAICELHYEPNSFQFFASDFEPDGYEGVREAFIGNYRTERTPIGVERGELTGSHENGGNPIGALMKHLTLAPGEEARLLFYLGTGRGEAAAEARRRYDAAGTDRAFEELRRFWDEKLGALTVRTPHENMNRSLNIWNLYQSEINVLFSRFSSFIEVGGRTGLGFRDTAQDAMCIPHAEPDMCKKRIEQLLNGVTTTGYGLHLFDPAWFEGEEEKEWSPTVVPTAEGAKHVHGLKDACADDALWLIPAIVEFVRETGEAAFLDKPVPYADGGEDSVWQHMKRILDFSYSQIGTHGVTKGLRADWNDCLNLGGGESAMVTFLLIWATEHFLDAARSLGRDDDVALYADKLAAMREIGQIVLWDGEWFLRGFTADGRPIGSHTAQEGKVHLESNTWAVASGAATREQGLSAMDAVDEWLYTPYGLMLNAPSFTVRDDGVGFVTRVYPGIKENGAVFSHPNPWAWVAECRLGRGGRAMKFYDALLPENQNDIMEIRAAEPYTYCQFIMGKDHAAHGRARHPFMTGSSGWAYFAATRYMLGVRPEFDRLTVDPCIPADWDGFELTRRWRGAEYAITVENPQHVEKGVRSIEVDGRNAEYVPVFESGAHTVRVIMG